MTEIAYERAWARFVAAHGQEPAFSIATERHAFHALLREELHRETDYLGRGVERFLSIYERAPDPNSEEDMVLLVDLARAELLSGEGLDWDGADLRRELAAKPSERITAITRGPFVSSPEPTSERRAEARKAFAELLLERFREKHGRELTDADAEEFSADAAEVIEHLRARGSRFLRYLDE